MSRRAVLRRFVASRGNPVTSDLFLLLLLAWSGVPVLCENQTDLPAIAAWAAACLTLEVKKVKS